MRLSLAIFTLFCFCAAALADDAVKPQDSLDQQLLDDLGSDLLDGLDDIPTIPPKTGAKDESTKDVQNLDQLGEGEDIQLGDEADPLTRIGQKMRTVEELISQQKTSSKTKRLQQEILDDLAVLIELQKKQCAKCKAAGKSKPKSGQPTQGNSAAGDPTRPLESTERVGQEKVKPEDILSLDRFVKEKWGELPDRYIQQMESAGIERFLQKYDKEIREYYKRLAEEGGDTP